MKKSHNLKWFTYEKLEILQLPVHKQRRWRGDLVETFNIVRVSISAPSDELFLLATTTHQFKHFEMCFQVNSDKHIFNCVVKQSNFLPTETVNAETISRFKSGLDLLLNVLFSFSFTLSTKLFWNLKHRLFFVSDCLIPLFIEFGIGFLLYCVCIVMYTISLKLSVHCIGKLKNKQEYGTNKLCNVHLASHVSRPSS